MGKSGQHFFRFPNKEREARYDATTSKFEGSPYRNSEGMSDASGIGYGKTMDPDRVKFLDHDKKRNGWA